MRRIWFVLPLLAVAGLACGDEAPTAPVDETPLDTASFQIPAEATAWLQNVIVPFDGPHLTLPHDDLQFLRDLVGDARIVSLGENTHGTRDFFEMKARILRFLVEEMDFDAFAIEATLPEAFRLDDYVRTGVGEPAELLSGLYFWTWNTQSVLEMIEWMREHNEAGGEVGFYGFDMQFPGMGVHNVVEYVRAVDPDAVPAALERVGCMAALANGPNGQSPSPGYREQTAEYRSDCRASLEAMRRDLLDNQAAYEAVSGPEAFARTLRSLRVSVQYDLMISGDQGRDESMAENTVWLADHLGPDSKIVVWAHNYHVSTLPNAQGSFMRTAFGDAMIIMAFTHERGGFTAVRQNGSSYLGLQSHSLDEVRPFSYEHYLSSVDAPRYFLDMRGLDLSVSATSWLAGPRASRAIGCCYDPGNRLGYWSEYRLPDIYDVLIHFKSTRATAVLPTNPPRVF
jgi:erythromycin esterase